MDNMEALKKLLAMADAPVKPKPKPSFGTYVISWFIFAVVAVVTSTVLGVLAGFTTLGWKWITKVL